MTETDSDITRGYRGITKSYKREREVVGTNTNGDDITRGYTNNDDDITNGYEDITKSYNERERERGYEDITNGYNITKSYNERKVITNGYKRGGERMRGYK